MSRTVSIAIACDQCETELTEAEAIVTPVKFGKREGLVDLCQSCVLDWENDLEPLFTGMRPASEPVTHKCEHCERMFNTVGALRIHATRIHGKDASS